MLAGAGWAAATAAVVDVGIAADTTYIVAGADNDLMLCSITTTKVGFICAKVNFTGHYADGMGIFVTLSVARSKIGCISEPTVAVREAR